VAPVSWSEKQRFVSCVCRTGYWKCVTFLVGSSDHGSERAWTIEEKARILTEGSKLVGEQLSAYLA